MAEFASDTFTGTEGTELSAYSSAWTRHTSYTGNSEIADNRVRVSGTSATSYWHSGTPGGADYSVSADLFFKEASGGNAFTAVAGRIDTTANTSYRAGYGGSSSDRWELSKFVAGTNTLLGSSAASITDETSHNCKLRMVGTTIELYKDGESTALISVTDSSITAAGKAGFRISDGTTSDTNGIHIDNFSAVDIGGTTYSYTASGGAAAGGEATPTLSAVPAASGGAVSAGVAALALSVAILASGGAQTGGTADTSFSVGGATYSYTAAGGAQTGGAATLVAEWAPPAAGGLQSEGAAAVVGVWPVQAAGGATSGGTAGASYTSGSGNTYTYVATGGLQSGGVATLSATWPFNAAGGATIGGSALVSGPGDLPPPAGWGNRIGTYWTNWIGPSWTPRG